MTPHRAVTVLQAISTAGIDRNRRCPVRYSSAHNRGFSLVELLAVLALIGLIMGLVGGSIVRNLDSIKTRRAGKDVVTALRYTRGQAIITREQQWLEINIEKMTYLAPGKEAVVLPEGVEISVKTALSDILDESTGRIRFFPDGSSTGGRISLMAGHREWLISVAWLTGEITLEDLANKG